MRPRPPLPRGPFLVVGLARSGRAAALALRVRGEQVIGLDAGAPAARRELEGAGVEVHAGEGEGLELLARTGTVIKSPGVPAEAPVIAAARGAGMPVLGELELGWRLLDNEFVAVTGTNGKTTTVELLSHIHRAGGLPVAVAGNVGSPVSGLVGVVDPGATVVCESSSFQLEDAPDFAPEGAVLLNLAPDHLDRHGTFEAYVEAKLSIFARQHGGDVAVVPSALLAGADGWRARVARRLDRLAAVRVSFGEEEGADLRLCDGALRWREQPLLAGAELRLRGRHNLDNAMAAAALCLARGLDPGAVAAGLRSFAGVAHRLEEVAVREGVSYVNDSKATNVASTVVALDAFAGERGVHLILGGRGKGQDFSALRLPVQRSCKGVYLIGEAAGELAAALREAEVSLRDCGDLERALADASAAARPGEVVLLSPACASFDQFDDFEARGERFRELVCG